jgi:hypothetical protein
LKVKTDREIEREQQGVADTTRRHLIMQDEGQVIVFFLIACGATIGSTYSLYFIWKYGSRTSISSQLLLALHLTLLLEEIFTYPYAYTSQPNLCRAIGFFHFYSGLANIMVTGLLTTHFANYLLFSNVNITHVILTYKTWIIVGFPLITLLPFSTNSYGRTNDHWCSAIGYEETSRIWAIAVFYGWAWIVILYSFSLITYVIHRAHVLDNTLMTKVFSSVGIYVFVTILCWIPRTIPRFMILFWNFHASSSTYLWTAIPVYLSGIFYSFILYRDRIMLTGDEQGQVAGTAPIDSDIHFTWEDLECVMISEYRRSISMSGTGRMHSIGGSERNSSIHKPAMIGDDTVYTTRDSMTLSPQITKSPLLGAQHLFEVEKHLDGDM